MTKDQYLKTVSAALRRSGMKRKIRRRLETDLSSDFTARLEKGESSEEIIRTMGTPDQLAAEFLKENSSAKARTPVEKAFLISGSVFAVITAACGVWIGADQLLISRFQTKFFNPGTTLNNTTVIGGADGPTAVFITVHRPEWMIFLSAFFLIACIVSFILYFRSRRNKK